MNAITSLTPQQLRHAADLQERILALQRELNALLGGSPPRTAAGPGPSVTGPRQRKLSARGLANIRAAAKRRWAKFRADAGTKAKKPKRQMSAAARARLSAIAKARWAKAHAQGRAKL